jgi:hypothetical protein
MGDHPDFEAADVVTAEPLADDTFYLAAPDAFIDLTPLVVARDCPRCRQREVYYADRVDERDGVALRSFDRGHLLYDQSIEGEVRSLLGGTENLDSGVGA